MTENKNGPGIKIPVLLGPTAVGKSDLAIRLCERFGLELISCDSRQIYRFMNIGTAKPTIQQQEAIRHWMIDIINPDQEFSCFHYAESVRAVIQERHQAGKRLLLCGGTGLYFNSLFKGLGPTTPPNKEFREKYFEKARVNGNQVIYDELALVDPVTAASTHPSNIQRNIRALEVYYQSQTPLSVQKQKALPPGDLDFLIVICSMHRNTLYKRIDDRVDTMIREGLIDEFYSLREKGYGPSDPGLRCVGYKELFAMEQQNRPLKEAAETIKINTRHYAKRQMTWFRHQIQGHEISMENPDDVALETMIRHYLNRPDDKV